MVDRTYQLNGTLKPTLKRFADLNGPDFFPTPAWATHALIDNEQFKGDIWNARAVSCLILTEVTCVSACLLRRAVMLYIRLRINRVSINGDRLLTYVPTIATYGDTLAQKDASRVTPVGQGRGRFPRAGLSASLPGGSGPKRPAGITTGLRG